MWINNENDIKRFEETINNCKDSVLIITDSGEQYDLKKTKDFYLGIASFLKADRITEPEVFTSNPADENLLLGYLKGKEMKKAC